MQSSHRRAKGTVVERPIVYGSSAEWLGRKAAEGKTHQWTVYVRGVANEDISFFIRKVKFNLHPSFPNPSRVIDKPPFELTEYGWGEFMIGIVVYFDDPVEKPLEFVHYVRLFNGPVTEQNPLTRKPVVHEILDEIVFVDPTESLLAKLNATPSKGSSKAYKQTEDKALTQIEKAKEQVRQAILSQLAKYESIEHALENGVATLRTTHNDVCKFEGVSNLARDAAFQITSVIKPDAEAIKEAMEHREVKEPKTPKEGKSAKEPKTPKEGKVAKEGKALKESKDDSRVPKKISAAEHNPSPGARKRKAFLVPDANSEAQDLSTLFSSPPTNVPSIPFRKVEASDVSIITGSAPARPVACVENKLRISFKLLRQVASDPPTTPSDLQTPTDATKAPTES
eukprot:TRINITY_DN4034_c0_g3_i1.p1 TRINITY_DN4034_c0_g3~~TRINITY_DN4034_c0_g3_i1.p1  ORF type:complete len:397 (+),score=100.44 TRINITY_DN4034_c0_g3_i1:54-1244(+)